MSHPAVLLGGVALAVVCLIVAAARGRANTAGVGVFALVGGYGLTFALSTAEVREPMAITLAAIVATVGAVILLMAAFGPKDPGGGTDR